jgi:hypothetical protein
MEAASPLTPQFPLLALRLIATLVAHGRRLAATRGAASASHGTVYADADDLDAAAAAITGVWAPCPQPACARTAESRCRPAQGMARVPAALLPEYPPAALHAAIVRSCRLGGAERAWVCGARVDDALAVVCANALRARPAAPFAAYVRALARALGPERRGDGMRRVAQCAAAVAGCPELSAGRMDAVRRRVLPPTPPEGGGGAPAPCGEHHPSSPRQVD